MAHLACTIRVARESDARDISDLILLALRVTNAKDYGPDIIARVASNFGPLAVQGMIARRHVLVALAEGRIVGTAGLDGRIVRSTFVAPDVQRQRVGWRLMLAVEAAAREAGVATLALQSSITAEAFYTALGFRAVRDHFEGDERTIIMERDLTDPTARIPMRPDDQIR